MKLFKFDKKSFLIHLNLKWPFYFTYILLKKFGFNKTQFLNNWSTPRLPWTNFTSSSNVIVWCHRSIFLVVDTEISAQFFVIQRTAEAFFSSCYKVRQIKIDCKKNSLQLFLCLLRSNINSINFRLSSRVGMTTMSKKNVKKKIQSDVSRKEENKKCDKKIYRYDQK